MSRGAGVARRKPRKFIEYSNLKAKMRGKVLLCNIALSSEYSKYVMIQMGIFHNYVIIESFLF